MDGVDGPCVISDIALLGLGWCVGWSVRCDDDWKVTVCGGVVVVVVGGSLCMSVRVHQKL